MVVPLYFLALKAQLVVLVSAFIIGGDLVRGLGGQGRRVSAENFFLPSPPKCEICGGGTAGDSLYSRITIFNPWILCIYSGFRGF